MPLNAVARLPRALDQTSNKTVWAVLFDQYNSKSAWTLSRAVLLAQTDENTGTNMLYAFSLIHSVFASLN